MSADTLDMANDLHTAARCIRSQSWPTVMGEWADALAARLDNYAEGVIARLRGEATHVDPDEVVVTHTFEAKRKGRCVLCPDSIVTGDLIAGLDTDPVTYAHEACVPGGTDPDPWVLGGGHDG